MENENRNRCQKCRYYLEHYIKDNTRYFPIGGHCISKEVNARNPRKKFELHDDCEFWEPIEIRKAERRESIKQTLRHMRKSLADIATILQDDEEPEE